jgi:hypothetical protein
MTSFVAVSALAALGITVAVLVSAAIAIICVEFVVDRFDPNESKRIALLIYPLVIGVPCYLAIGLHRSWVSAIGCHAIAVAVYLVALRFGNRIEAYFAGLIVAVLVSLL